MLGTTVLSGSTNIKFKFKNNVRFKDGSFGDT